MNTKVINGVMTIALILLATNNSMAQSGHHSDPDVVLHVNEDLGLCDFDIHSDLTQSEWKRFTKEGGNIIFLNPLSSAKPLGIKHWDLTIEMTASDVDETSGAWNNTFHHPDEEHWLNEGQRTSVPAMRFRMGITEKLDAGIYYAPSQPFGANYGFLGLEAKYAYINDTARNWAASVRASFVTDANIKDFNINVYGLDFSASKTFYKVLTPYAGIAMNYTATNEVTEEVNLHSENHFQVRGIAGVELKWKFVNLGYEFMLGGGFNNRALKIGVTF